MALKVLKGVPLVVSAALALLPSIDGAISRSSCCFEGTKSRDALDCRCFTKQDASRQGASKIRFVKYTYGILHNLCKS